MAYDDHAVFQQRSRSDIQISSRHVHIAQPSIMSEINRPVWQQTYDHTIYYKRLGLGGGVIKLAY